MTKHYQDYKWKEGIPYGINALDSPRGINYKISMDPYRKRITIEKYQDQTFDTVLYDTAFLDFRSLKSLDQTAWQKSILTESPKQITCLLRNQDDRVVFVEEHHMENGCCRECRVHSPQGYPLSIHKMYYKALGDRFDGVILYDPQFRPVMYKTYQIDPKTSEFSDLIEECWKVEKTPNG